MKKFFEDIILSIGLRLRFRGGFDQFLTKLFWKRHNEIIKEFIDKLDLDTKNIKIIKIRPNY